MLLRIRINPKIWIRIPYHFWLKFWHWRRFSLSECSCCCYVVPSKRSLSTIFGCTLSASGESEFAGIAVRATPDGPSSIEPVQLATVVCVAEAAGRSWWRSRWRSGGQLVVASDGDALP